jgi:NAD(P)-dependent dehydrogenase (short-subunit alcohol dehydrogenase family)
MASPTLGLVFSASKQMPKERRRRGTYGFRSRSNDRLPRDHEEEISHVQLVRNSLILDSHDKADNCASPALHDVCTALQFAMTVRIRDKRLAVVITGVSRGLGRAMAEEFVSARHKVFGCARTECEIDDLTSKHPDHDFQIVDVASDTEVRAWAERLVQTHGAPNLVLNNAAVINLKAPLWEVGVRDFSDEVDINIKGVVNVIRHFLPPMILRRQGVIVNFGSRWGRTSEKQMAPYCATKWAVVALTRALAEELRPKGVAAIALNPGIVRTGMLQRYLGGINPDTSSYMAPEEWAKIAVPFILRLGLKDTGKIRTIQKPLERHANASMCRQRDEI